MLLYKLEPISYHEKIILCAPFLDIPEVFEILKNNSSGLNFSLGAQNISPSESSPNTGETTVDMIKYYVSYIMIGHSERRHNLNETNEMVNQKITLSRDHGLKTVVCVSSLDELLSVKIEFPTYSDLILYEPLSAIGSNIADNPQNANLMAKEIKNEIPAVKVLYGGSVNSKNINDFISQPSIDGVGIGGASLEVSSFWDILKNVAKK